MQPLASKDASSFRAALQMYENKHYKKSLKAVEALLKKHAKNGECLALKGLNLTFLDRQDEAKAYLAQALELDPSSFIVWHINGICRRQDRQYEDAIRFYTKAHQLDPQNATVLRDLALLQAQARQFGALVTSRHAMLTAQPQYRQSWTALAVAQFLAQDYGAALKTLSSFEELLKQPLPKQDLENTEVALFKNLVIYKGQGAAKALEHVDEIADTIMDVGAVLTARAQYLLELERLPEAAEAYQKLIERNPEEGRYFDGLEESLQAHTPAQRLALYRALAKQYPKSHYIKGKPLTLLQGNELAEYLEQYLEQYLRQGVPATFSLLKPYYRQSHVRPVLVEVVGRVGAKLDLELAQNPTDLLWTLHYLALHHSELGNHDEAIKTIDRAIDHTPTLADLVMTKAKIIKHTGDLAQAAEVMDQARQLDLQDRSLNTKAGRYFLRAGLIDKAVQTVSLFTKNDPLTGSGVYDLIEMQAVGFLTEQAEAYARQGNLGLALKRFHNVLSTFSDYINDQYDFHYYCMRKGTVRDYLDMLAWADRLYKDRRYVRAARGAIKIYLGLHDGRNVVKDKKSSKQDRAREIKDEEALRRKDGKDTDVLGKTLVATKDPLGQAYAIWKPMETSDAAHVLGAEIYLRQSKYVLALTCLVKGRAAAAAVPQYELNALAYRIHTAMSQDQDLPAGLKVVAARMLPRIVTASVDTADFLDTQVLGESVESTLVWAQTKVLLGQEQGVQSKLQDIFKTRVTLAQAQEAVRLCEGVRSAAQKQWPHMAIE